jgi:hypothetical protein
MSKITTRSAMAAAMAAVGAASFPVTVFVHNNTFHLLVEPESSTEVGPFSTAPVTVKDESQFVRLLGNVEARNFMAGWPEGTGMSVHYPEFVPDGPVVQAGPTEAEVKATEEAERQAAAQAEAARVEQEMAAERERAEAEAKKAAEAGAAGKAVTTKPHKQGR